MYLHLHGYCGFGKAEIAEAKHIKALQCMEEMISNLHSCDNGTLSDPILVQVFDSAAVSRLCVTGIPSKETPIECSH
jgi:hypothetical protein